MPAITKQAWVSIPKGEDKSYIFIKSWSKGDISKRTPKLKNLKKKITRFDYLKT